MKKIIINIAIIISLVTLNTSLVKAVNLNLTEDNNDSYTSSSYSGFSNSVNDDEDYLDTNSDEEDNSDSSSYTSGSTQTYTPSATVSSTNST